MTLSEKYRPRTLADVIGQPKAVALLERIQPHGRAYYITGGSGTGKTTIARILANQVADKLYTREIIGRQLTPAELKRWIDQTATTTLFGSGGYALIVNESHGLRKDTIEALLDVLENLPSNAVVIFTTTRDGADLFEEQLDAGPFASRCVPINLQSRGLCPQFAKRLHEIAQAENLDGQPLSAYENLLKKHRNNFRAALQEIECGRMIANPESEE